MQKALADFEAGLALTCPGEHPAHAELAASHLLVLSKLGRTDEGLAVGAEQLAAARGVELGPQTHSLLEALARLHSAAGLHDSARGLADESIALLEDFEAGGLVLGGAYETRALVALEAGDQASFERFAGSCAAIYRSGRNPLLTARYAALMTRAEAARIAVTEEIANAAASWVARTLHELSVTQFNDSRERALTALRSLVQAAGVDAGFIYTIQSDGPKLAAQEGAVVPPDDLDARVGSLLERLTDEHDTVETARVVAPGPSHPAGEAGDSLWRNQLGEVFTALPLTHASKRGAEITGVVVLRGRPDSRRVPPQLLSGISQALHQSGDVATLLAAL